MTTTVIVKAHCAKEKEVVISRDPDPAVQKDVILQDGGEWEGVVYDDKMISVYERTKS